MKFLLLNGASCSGKSTIIDRIMSEKEDFYKLSNDSQKWLFSKYTPATHREPVQNVVLALAEAVCTLRYNIVCDSALHRDFRQKLLQIPAKHGYEIIEVNLEAEYDVLVKRFDERVARALAGNVRISNTSRERHKELYETYHGEKNPSALTLRTDHQSLEEITRGVLDLI